jgi:serine/threonine-protein kinase
MIAAVFIAALVVAAGVLGFIFTDIGRAKDVVIPDVATQSVADATAELEALGLKVRVDEESNSDVPEGNVIRTDPAQNETAKEGDTVTLIVSEGPDRRSVPSVLKLEYDEAEKLLRASGFNPVRRDAFSDDVPLGRVISQTPAGNALANRDSDVTVVVSKGPDLVTVPNLLLEDQSRAKEVLENEDLVLGDVLTRETSRRPPGTIVAQDPTAGQKVKKNTAVTITIAKAPEPKTVEVPNVVGQEAGAAQAKLEGLGFTVVSDSAPDPNVDVNLVISQDPDAGTQLDPTTGTITIIFSTGPDTGVPSETPGATP